MPGNTKKHRRGNGEGSVYQRKDGTSAASDVYKRQSLEKHKISLTLALSLGATMFFLVRG